MLRLILILSFLPYFSLVLRVPGDVQPWATLLSWVCIFGIALSRRKAIKLQSSDVFLILITGFFLFYRIDIDNFDIVNFFRKTLVFFFSLSLVIIAKHFQIKAMRQALMIAVIAYLLFALLQLASTNLYASVAGLFTRLKDVDLLNRGVASLAPEATDFGLTCVYLIVFALILRSKDPERKSYFGINIYSIIIAICVFCVILSRSGSGFIGLALVGGLALASLSVKKRYFLQTMTGLTLVIATFIFIPQELVENTRGLQLINSLFSGDDVLFGTSFAHRSIHNIVAGIAFVESNGLGHGAGSFTDVAPAIYDQYQLAGKYGLSTWHQFAVRETLQNGALGVTALLLTEFGVFGILLIVVVFSTVVFSNIPFKWAIIALMAITWLQSFPAAYPMFWILIGLANHPTISSKKTLRRRQNPIAGRL